MPAATVEAGRARRLLAVRYAQVPEEGPCAAGLIPARSTILTELFVILGLVLVNGLLAGTEIAIVSLRKSRLQELVDSGSPAARAVQRLRDQPERFFATVQVGITIIGATTGAFGGATFAHRLEPELQRVPWLAPYASEIALAVVVLLVAFLSLVLGELVPKSLAMRSAEGYALLTARLLLGLAWLARPLVWFLTATSNLVLRLFGDKTSFTESRLSSDELQLLVDEAAKTGSVHPQVGAIASRAIAFGELQAMDVMVPRAHVISVPRSATADEVKRVLLEEGHSRMPVHDGSLDNVVGYVAMKDVIAVALEGDLIKLVDLVRPAYFVPETMRAVELLRELQARRTHLTMVVDEQGSLAGIVTLEDLLEELVGEIVSEQEELLPAPIRREPDGSAVVQGTVPIRDLNRELQLDLSEGDGWTTLAGLCNALAGRIPVKGERLSSPDGTTLEVVDASPRRVRVVRVVPPPKPDPQE